MATNYTALGILGLAAAGLLVYEVMRPKGPATFGGTDVPDGGTRAPTPQGGTTTASDPAFGGTSLDAVALEEAQKAQRGELRALPANVDVSAIEGPLGVSAAGGAITATGALALHAAAQGAPVTFDVWLDFGDLKGPVETRTVQPGTTQRLDLYARHDPFAGSLLTRLYVRARDAGGSVDRGALPSYLSISQGGVMREYVDAPPAPPAPRQAPIPGTNVGPNE